MTRRTVSPAPGILLGFALMLALVAAFLAAPAASAAGVKANLRVVTWQGKVVFDGEATADTATIKPDAGCLSGSAGPARTIEGAKAINLLADAAANNAALRPLKISDGDYGFGICGLAGITAKDKEWWEIRTNYASAQVGIEGLDVKSGDSILLYLNRSWEALSPDALYLRAPARVKKGKKVRVRVFAYNTAGKRAPVKGAKVMGATRRTNANGYTWIKVRRQVRTIARKAGLIPSNRALIRIR